MIRKLAFLVVMIMALAIPASARADGIIIPDPPICDPDCPTEPIPIDQLVIRYHHVEVVIEDQVAVTHVDQVFYNPNSWQIEGTYIFPIPLDAAVTSFTLWVDGQAVEGKILDAQEARQTYEEIVRGLRDPALLEYAGRGAVQARIFPIAAGGERRVELEYSQVLAAENELVRYIYPLSTEKFSQQPLENVSVSVEIRSGTPIRAVYSPSHTVAISREGEYQARAGYEATNVLPESDFALYYSIGETQAFHLLTFRDPSDPMDGDGFFLAMLAPMERRTMRVIPKDVLLVLDHSGSMEGEKFQQAQEALKYILGQLNVEDRFNVIAFSTGVEQYASGLRPAEEANEAIGWVERISAIGSTDINRALLEAAASMDAERPTYLIFLTDGLPTEGVTESERILENFAQAASDNLRLFPFGVGYDVDTYLLDSLAQAHHGKSSYVLPGERLVEVLSAFYAQISTPVLTDIQLDFGELATYDLYPSPLPDLFSGSQVVVVGRYRQSGAATVRLTGYADGELQTFIYPEQVFTRESRANDGLAALPRLWATRKIGYLLNQIRLNGPDEETVDQVVKLSIRYGIVTPYTSYLVTEELLLGEAEQERIVGETLREMEAAPTMAPSGQAAVQKAADQGAMAGAGGAMEVPVEAANQVKIVGARTYVLANGAWTDTNFDPTKMETEKVAFLSEDYFALTQASPELAAAFALGQRVIALAGEKAYEVVAEGMSLPEVKIEATPYPADEGTEPTPIASGPYPEPSETPSTESVKSPGPCLGGMVPVGLLAPLGWLGLKRKVGRQGQSRM